MPDLAGFAFLLALLLADHALRRAREGGRARRRTSARPGDARRVALAALLLAALAVAPLAG